MYVSPTSRGSQIGPATDSTHLHGEKIPKKNELPDQCLQVMVKFLTNGWRII